MQKLGYDFLRGFHADAFQCIAQYRLTGLREDALQYHFFRDVFGQSVADTVDCSGIAIKAFLPRVVVRFRTDWCSHDGRGQARVLGYDTHGQRRQHTREAVGCAKRIVFSCTRFVRVGGSA